MQAKIQFTVKLPIRITKKRKMFLASCPVLDVSSQGETEERAKKNVTEALYLFLRSCLERETLDAVLKQCGFTAVLGNHQEQPEPLDKAEYVDVPLSLLSQFEDPGHCHAV